MHRIGRAGFEDGPDVIQTEGSGRRYGFEGICGKKRSENAEAEGTEGVGDEEVNGHPPKAKYTRCQPPVWRRCDFRSTYINDL